MQKHSKNIIVLKEVDSTNNYANQLILSNAAEEGTVVLAHHQFKGRGQHGNQWESEAGKNLLASLIIYPGFLYASKQFLISKLTSLAVVDFLKEKVDEVKIKWPNDIYVGNKKIAGILIENSIKGKNVYTSIVGIGLNLNQEVFLSEAPNPVSLKKIYGKYYDVEIALNEIIVNFSTWYEKLKSGKYEEIDSAYFNNLYRNEGFYTYKTKVREFKAKIIGIGVFGQLQLLEESGNTSEFMFKEIEFVL